MRILQVLATLGTGGAEHCAVELTNELIRQGNECDVLTLFDVAQENDLVKQLNPCAKVSSLGKKQGLDQRTKTKIGNKELIPYFTEMINAEMLYSLI